MKIEYLLLILIVGLMIFNLGIIFLDNYFHPFKITVQDIPAQIIKMKPIP